jgi:hypothetical protein
MPRGGHAEWPVQSSRWQEHGATHTRAKRVGRHLRQPLLHATYPQSSSASRRTAGAAGFLNLSPATRSLAVTLLSRFCRPRRTCYSAPNFCSSLPWWQLPLRGGSMMSNGISSALNSEQDLPSIPMAQRGLSRLAIARLKSAGVPVAPLLKRVGRRTQQPAWLA